MRLVAAYQEAFWKAKEKFVKPDRGYVEHHLEIKAVKQGERMKLFNRAGVQDWQLVAKLDGKQVGYMDIEYLPSANRFYVGMVEVEEEYKRLGIATMMAKKATDLYGIYVQGKQFFPEGRKLLGSFGDEVKPKEIDKAAEKKLPGKFRLRGKPGIAEKVSDFFNPMVFG